LLEDARLVSATDRSEAERDGRKLAASGWIELKPVRYKPHLIDRVIVPLAAEGRWREAFGFVAPSNEEQSRIREFSWAAQLGFVREARLNLSFDELVKINDFIKTLGTLGNAQAIVPIKERSLELFGDEKRLDQLTSSALFRPGRLDLTKHLRCEIIGVPLAWKRGPSVAHAKPLIVLENAATWHSYCRWNDARAFFSAVVYGDGNRFVDGIRYLRDLFSELGGTRPVLYFGDLDPQGLLIPQEASARAQAAGLPAIHAELWSYHKLLALGQGHWQPWEGEPPSSTLCDWLGNCAEPARQLFSAGQRLAQERIGWEFLQGVTDYGV
jgi:hypothetical protein